MAASLYKIYLSSDGRFRCHNYQDIFMKFLSFVEIQEKYNLGLFYKWFLIDWNYYRQMEGMGLKGQN